MITCKKKKYKTIDEARIALTKIFIKSKRQKKPIRAYKCDFCGGFHISSMSKDKYEKWVKDRPNRNKRRQERFIQTEGEYWENVFNTKS